MTSRNARRRRARARATGAGTSRTAPVAKASAPTVQADSKLRQSGMDRLVHVDSIQKFAAGETVADIRVEPNQLSRLSHFASIFQRIKYLKLRFEVRSQVSTSASGGYVAAFIRDSSENAISLNGLIAQAGSQTLNWWQSADVTIPSSPDLFYTTLDWANGDWRMVSPGRFVVICDGKATVEGSLSINIHWSVELSEASLEEQEQGPTHELVLEDHYTWYFPSNEQTLDVALMDCRGRHYTTADDLHVEVGTIWELPRPQVFGFYGWPSTDSQPNWYAPFQVTHMVVGDRSDNGCVFPAVLYHGKGDVKPVIELIKNKNVGTGVMDDKDPVWVGELVALKPGDVLREVDSQGQPYNSQSMFRGRRRDPGGLALRPAWTHLKSPGKKGEAEKNATPTPEGGRSKRSVDETDDPIVADLRRLPTYSQL